MPDASRFRFDAFEVCPRQRQLWRHGTKVKIHGQPFQILLLMVERPGEIISREEIRQRLWSADTFVDFEHSLNTAVMKLRQALGDTAEESRYIETVARNGYRFIATVQKPVALAPTDVNSAAQEVQTAPRHHSSALLYWAIGETAASILLLTYFFCQRRCKNPQSGG
jgi:DNA-binding winged helix-turn-helix (wHTH) protein